MQISRDTRRTSLRTMFTRSYMLIMVLPTLLLCVVLLADVSFQARGYREEVLSEYTAQVGRSLDAVIEEMMRLGAIHQTRYDILLTLRRDYGLLPQSLPVDSRTMADLISVAASINQRIHRLSFVTKDQHVFTQFVPPYLDDRRAIFARINELQASNKGMMAFRPQAIAGRSDAYIPVVIEMRDPHTWIVVGYACIDILYSELDSVFAGDSLSQSNNVLLINSDRIVYDSSIPPDKADQLQSGVGEAVMSLIADQRDLAGEHTLDINGRSSAVTIRVAENRSKDWLVIVYATGNDSLGQIWSRAGQFLAATALLLTLSALIGRRLFSGFMSQVDRLRSTMSDAIGGQIYRIETPSTILEMQTLYESYNSMADRIVSSIKRQYELELMHRKSEMDMLLLQINPHFLYNTLNLISSIGQVHGISEIERICLCLSSMLRYSLMPSNYVALDEELKQVAAFVTIQQARFPESVYYECLVASGLRRCRVIKFILQPIIENAFKHALERKRGYRCIKVQVESRGDCLQIDVSDNGSGIPAPLLEALKIQLTDLSKDLDSHRREASQALDAGIGLRNVHKRLLYTYGSQYGVSIDSEPGSGTTVSLRLPVQMWPEEPQGLQGRW